MRLTSAAFRTAFFLLVAGALSAQHYALPASDDSAHSLAIGKEQAPGMNVKQLSQSPLSFEVTFRRGDDVIAGMNEFAAEYHLKTSQVTAVAGFGSALLGWGNPIGHPRFMRIPINQEVEAVLAGNFTVRNGTPHFHAHAVCMFEDGSTKGGHLIDARVGLTMEAMVTELETGDAEPGSK